MNYGDVYTVLEQLKRRDREKSRLHTRIGDVVKDFLKALAEDGYKTNVEEEKDSWIININDYRVVVTDSEVSELAKEQDLDSAVISIIADTLRTHL